MSFYSPVCGSITPNIGGSITAVSDKLIADSVSDDRGHRFKVKADSIQAEGGHPGWGLR
jgi:hypothetical protein